MLWGATGHARVLNELAQQIGWRVVLVIDNRDLPPPLVDVPIAVGVERFDSWLDQRAQGEPLFGAVAVGGNRGAERIELLNLLAVRQVLLPNLVHPTAFVALDATLGSGSQVLAHATVCSHARLGRGVIVNTAASVDHDTELGDGVHIGPGAHLAGEIRIGARAFIGAGAVVLPRLVIGAGAIVGAGAVVTRNVAPGATVVGNPARATGVRRAE